MDEQFKKIPLKELRASLTNPRKHFDKKQLDELKGSIKEKGIVVPLLVRSVNGKYEVVAGERRYRCAVELKLDEAPCMVRDLSDEQALEIQVIENLQREDVHPLDEAEGFAQLISKGKHTPESIAGKVGKSVSWVYQALKLNDLIPELKKAFWDERINRSHGIFLSRYSAEIQKRVYQSEIGRYRNGVHNVSLESLRREVNDYQIDLHSGPFKKDDATLVPAAGACNTCPKRSGYSPALFPEIKNKDYCLDTQCFHKKLKAFAQQRIDEIEEKGEKVVAVEGVYGSSIETGAGKKPIDKWSYEQVKEQKGKTLPKGIVRAVITADDNPARIGQTMLVRVKKEETNSGSGTTTTKRPGKAELFKRKVERESVKRIILKILEKVNAPQLPQKLFAMLVEDVASGHLSGGQQEFYQTYLGYPKKIGYGRSKEVDTVINNPKTSIGELNKIGMIGLIHKRFFSGVADNIAGILKIDAAGIRKSTKDEFEAAKKAKEAGKKKPLVSPMTKAIRAQKAAKKIGKVKGKKK